MNAYILSFVLTTVILLSLGYKWEIKIKNIIQGILIIGLSTGILAGLMIKILKDMGIIQVVLLELFIVFTITGLAILFFFYRDPERIPPNENGVILSPADGKLIYIKKIEGGKVPYSQKKGKRFELSEMIKSDIFNNGGYIIGISMNFLNVHINRAPISGRVKIIKHIKGRFFSLKKEDSLLQNERVLMVITNDKFSVGIVQIASRLVRRIVSYLKEGEFVEIGQKVGMIKFGSQVDIVLPNLDGLEIQVKDGDEIKAGSSVLAKYKYNLKD